jgi:hypothetical protein
VKLSIRNTLVICVKPFEYMIQSAGLESYPEGLSPQRLRLRPSYLELASYVVVRKAHWL